MDEKNIKTKECPLCKTILPYNKWLKVVGVYEEQQKYQKQLESELAQARDQSLKLKEEYKKIREKEKEIKDQYALKIKEERQKNKEIRADLKAKKQNIKTKLGQQFKIRQEKLQKKFERQRQIGLKKIRKEGIKEGIEKQKARAQKVSQMAEKYRKARDEANERVKQLEEMIKKGTTPQIEGFDFERELTSQLESKFPEDEIKPTGKKGDIIQTIKAENTKIGKIIYECKKTKEFQDKFIDQVRRDKARVIADYGIIVTWASKENKQGFWVDNDIIIVHPYGVLDVAIFLREILIQMYTLKLSRSEFEMKGKAILEFMQSEEFRTRIQGSITKSREAYEMLKREVKTHLNVWKKRAKTYEDIYRDTGIIRDTAHYILLHGKIPESLPKTKDLPSLQIPSQK